jgi:cell wall-associated NlpC family hydrolase
MPGAKGINGIALASVGAGVLFLWSGVSNQKVSVALQDLIKGTKPPAGPLQSFGFGVAGGSSSASSTPITATGSTIADDALKYRGHTYKYGGAPGTSGTAPWDCSSFCNWVLGHDLGMTLPGASSPGYSGASHGPATGGYMLWSRAQTVGRTGASSAAGDIVVWPTHMGIAIGGGQMVSATGPDGTPSTVVGNIDQGGPGGEGRPFIRRIIIGNPHA